MRPLPALTAGRSRWVLPMADCSAAALTGLLLEDQPLRQSRLLAAVLGDDPPLVLWTVCIADRAGFRPGSLDELAQWLAAHALGVLRWDGDRDAAAEAFPTEESESCAERVAHAVEVADLAAQLAAQSADKDDPATAASATLLGLLDDAGGWLAAVGSARAKDTSRCLPRWLAEADDSPAAALVRYAVGVLAGETPLPESAEIDLEACGGRGAEARRRWLAGVEGPARWLPSLAAKLSRLDRLENQFQEQLEAEKLEAMAEFAAGAGHEINNPLTVIAGRAQLFLRGEDDPERRRGLALISAQAMRVYEMIADMMLFARPPAPEPERFDLGQLVDRLVEELSPRATRQGTTLRRTGQPGGIEIEADPTQLRVAVQAMCHNSLEAIGRQGHIEISLGQNDRQVEIRVADDGPGISPEERPHLFDPYYSARQAGRGLGLGLSKCWRIVTNHGGRIEVTSRPGQGATFTIALPRHRPPA